LQNHDAVSQKFCYVATVKEYQMLLGHKQIISA